MIDLNKKYKTRSGLKVELWRTDLPSCTYTVAGLYYDKDGTAILEKWTAEGKALKTPYIYDLDLIEVKKKQVFYLNVNQDYSSGLFRTKSEAERHSSDNRIACIYVEFEEGQGL
jgi:hypothetical protein